MKVLGSPAFSNRTNNPYNWLLYTGMERMGVDVAEFSFFRLARGRHDIVHLHWPEYLVRSRFRTVTFARIVRLLVLLQLARARGARVFWTVHNLQSHEARHPRLERWFWKLFTRLIDGYITLTAGAQDQVRSRLGALGRRPGFVVPLGHFRGVYPNEVDPNTARAVLDIPREAEVIAFIGKIRPYKNVPHLIRTFRAAGGERSVLLIAGEARWPELRDEIIAEAVSDHRIRLFLDFVPEDRMQLYLNAADLVVLPFSEILNSASAMLVLSFNRPVLLPSKGAMEELQEVAGSEWVRTYDGELTPEILFDAMTWARAPGRPDAPSLDSLDWSEIRRSTVEAFRVLRGTVGALETATRARNSPAEILPATETQHITGSASGRSHHD